LTGETGYKLRKHIAKALQARSKAIRTALDAYNIAAAALDPPRPQLSWDVVVQYGFLAEFDLLRFSRRDVREEPWAKGPGRAAMDQHFDLLGAKEEIRKLDVEIQRFVTFMRDDEAIVRHHERRLRREGNVELAHQVWLYGRETSRFNAGHRRKLANLAKAPGCTAVMVPGVAVSAELRIPTEGVPSRDDDDEPMTDASPDNASPEGDQEEEEEEEEEEEVDEEAVADCVEAIYRVTIDGARR